MAVVFSLFMPGPVDEIFSPQVATASSIIAKTS